MIGQATRPASGNRAGFDLFLLVLPALLLAFGPVTVAAVALAVHLFG